MKTTNDDKRSARAKESYISAGFLPGAKQLGNAGEVMVIMLRNEIEKVGDAHRRVEPRMERRAPKIFGWRRLKTLDQGEAGVPKLR